MHTQRVGSICSRLVKILEATTPFARFAYPPPLARHAVPPGEDEITLSRWGRWPVLTVSPCFPRGSPWPKRPLTVHAFQVLNVPAAVNNNPLTPDRDYTRLYRAQRNRRWLGWPTSPPARRATPSHGGHFRVQFSGEQPVFTSSPVGPWRPLGSAASTWVCWFF